MKERLSNVWGQFTDHVALHAIVRRVPLLSFVPPVCAAPDLTEAQTSTPGAGRAEDILQQQCQATGQMRESADVCQQKAESPVTSIAASAETEIKRFREMVQLLEEDPMMRENVVEQQSLTGWENIPVACSFRVARPRHNGAPRRATPADKVAQQQKYAKCLAWASQCGLTDDQFQANLRAVPTDKNKRGVANLPVSWKSKCCCSAWEHARLLCVNDSIRIAATDAGRRLGGETVALQATEELSELMSSQASRLSRLLKIPQGWRGDNGLSVLADAHDHGSVTRRQWKPPCPVRWSSLPT